MVFYGSGGSGAVSSDGVVFSITTGVGWLLVEGVARAARLWVIMFWRLHRRFFLG